ncbi:MAG: FAD-dependent oxidoreductase [Deltaproteobacteria bacterium]|nr:FAD-dependent oxidoreductase [Deltaproteobacteria bacterium]
MSLIKSLIGRRQFLIATGVASTCALTYKKLAGLETRAAMAADAAATTAVKAAGNGCPHLLSPLKIRNKVLKNRIMHCVSPVYTLQGPENFPTDAWRNHYSNIAKNAAIVTMETSFGPYPKKYHTKEESFSYWSWEHISNNKWEDIPPVWNYVERAIEDIHCEGALIVFGTNTGDVGDAIVAGDVGSESGSDGLGGRGVQGAATMGAGGAPTAPGGQGGAPAAQGGQGGAPGGQGGAPAGGGGMPGMGRASKSVEDIVAEAKEQEEIGYDIYQMDSPTLEAVQAVRAATNMIIMSSGGMGRPGGGGAMSMGGSGTSGSNKPSASQIEEAVESARKLADMGVDILLMKGSGSAGASWESSKYEEGSSYYYAEAIKKAGIKIVTIIGGGMHNPIKNDEYIAKGATDMVAMTRPLFADMDLVKKVAAGMADDVIPCVQCQNCHAESMLEGPHFARCTVNPKWATPMYKLKNIEPPLKIKKVAVIGGGPAGMKAAITAAERGHNVTLYEKDSALGGLQKYTDYTPWVWPYKNFKDYLINQVKKAGVEVKLNTAATRDMIKSKGYDTVIVATGADIIESKMKGADAKNVFNILTSYSNRKSLGKSIVMIGAGKFGTEAALSMALDGYNVTVLSLGPDMIDPSDIGPHNVTTQTNLYRNHPNFKYHLETTVKDITGGKVTYTDKEGADKSIQADSIVIWNGLKARTEDADNFAGSANEVLVVGDCTGEKGRINRAIRSAFYAASRV